MTITVGSTEYELYFGIGFVRAIDEKYFTTGVGKAKFGLGLSVLLSKLFDGDILALQEIIYEGTCTAKKRPSQKDMDAFIDEHEDIDSLFEEVKEELKKSNATKNATANMIKVIDEMKAEQSPVAKNITKV